MVSTTSLTSNYCSSISQAKNLFATQKGLVVIQKNKRCWITTSFTVPSDFYVLVASRGIDLDYIDKRGRSHVVWPPGLHFPYPHWVGVSYLVTKQSTVLTVPVESCKTKDNFSVNVNVALTFRIMGDPDLGEDSVLVRKFVNNFMLHGLEIRLRESQEELIRTLTMSLSHSEIHGIRNNTQTGLLKTDQKNN